MKKFLIIIGLLTIPTVAAAQLSSANLTARLTTCEAHGYNPALADPCFMQVAIDNNDHALCDRIFWNSKKVSCKRQVQYSHSWTPAVLIPKLPFVIITVVFLFFLIKNPPRTSYMSGMLIGGAFAGFQVAVEQGAPEQLIAVQPYLTILQSPVTGFVTYAPHWLSKLPNHISLVLTHVIFYGLIIGLLLQGEKENRKHILIWTIFALIVTFWSHPAFDSVRAMTETMPVIGWS